MNTQNADIFISYRRKGGIDKARTVVAELQKRGFNSIFFDQDSLKDGRFDTRIEDAIRNCKDYILLLSKGSMDRCCDKNDWVAREISIALESRRNIIPLEVQDRGQEFDGFPKRFPDELESITNIQFSALRNDSFFNSAIDQLVVRLKSSPSQTNTHFESHSSETKGARIYISADADCRVTDYDEDFGVIIPANKKTPIILNQGDHDLTFISIEEPSVELHRDNYHVQSNDSCAKIEVVILAEITKVKKEKEHKAIIELQRRQKEEEEEKKRQQQSLRLQLQLMEKQKRQHEDELLSNALPQEIYFEVGDGKCLTFVLHPSKQLYYLGEDPMKDSKISSVSQKLEEKGISKGMQLTGLAVASFIPFLGFGAIAAASNIAFDWSKYATYINEIKKREHLEFGSNLNVQQLKEAKLSELGKFITIPIFEKNREYFIKKYLRD